MFQKVDPKSLSLNPFSAIGDQWMLITAGTPERLNTMTASWGGLGVLWGVPMAACYIRPQRYTKQFVDENGYFTLSFFGEEYRPQLSLCGSKSPAGAGVPQADGGAHGSRPHAEGREGEVVQGRLSHHVLGRDRGGAGEGVTQ